MPISDQLVLAATTGPDYMKAKQAQQTLRNAITAGQQGQQGLATGAQTQSLNALKLEAATRASDEAQQTRAIYTNPLNYDTGADGTMKPNTGRIMSDLYRSGQYGAAAAMTQSMVAQQAEATKAALELSKLNAAHAEQLASIAGSITDAPSYQAGINQAVTAGLVSPTEAQALRAQGWNPTTQAQMKQIATRGMDAKAQHDAMINDPKTAAQTQEALTNVAKSKQTIADTWQQKVLNASSSATDQTSLDAIRANMKASGAPDSALAQIPAMYSDQAVHGLTRAAMTAHEREMLDARLQEVRKLNTPAELAAVAEDPHRTTEERNTANAALKRLNAYQLAGRPVSSSTTQVQLTPEAMKILTDQVQAGKPLPYMGKDSGNINKQVYNALGASNPGIDLASAAAGYKADAASLAAYTKTLDNISGFEKGALKNLKLFTDAAENIPDTGIPWLNTPVRLLDEKLVGSDKMAAVNAARQIGLREIARITNDPKMSGVLSDSARHEVMEFSPKDATLPQIRRVAKMVIQDVANVHEGIAEQHAAIKERIGKGGGATGGGATYKATATGPDGHKIGSNDGGATWFDVATGKKVQ